MHYVWKAIFFTAGVWKGRDLTVGKGSYITVTVGKGKEDTVWRGDTLPLSLGLEDTFLSGRGDTVTVWEGRHYCREVGVIHYSQGPTLLSQNVLAKFTLSCGSLPEFSCETISS